MAKKAQKKKKEENTTSEVSNFKELLGLAAQGIAKKFPDAFQAFVYESEKMEHKYYDTGSVSMNVALGGRGILQGRILEIWGPSSGGKTSLALEVAWHIQRNTGKGVVFVDLEHKFDRSLFSTWRGGFIPELTYYVEPWTGEEGMEIVKDFVQSPGIGVIILDSVSALVPRKVLEGEQNPMAYQARLIRDYLPDISGLASKTGVTILTVNQVRAKLEASQARGRYKLKKTGGYALEHWTCTSLYMQRDGTKTSEALKRGELTDGFRDLGHWVIVHVDKNHAGQTLLRNFNLCLLYGRGFDTVSDLIERAISVGLIVQSGAWYSLGEDRFQGKTSLRSFIDERPDVQQSLWAEIQSMQLACVDERELAVIDPSQTCSVSDHDGIEISEDDITPEMREMMTGGDTNA